MCKCILPALIKLNQLESTQIIDYVDQSETEERERERKRHALNHIIFEIPSITAR